MLILTRKKEESIIIDDEIEVKILEIDNNRVQIGIDAPNSVPIHREEVYKEIQTENKLAAQGQVDLSNKLAKKIKKEVNRADDEEN
jgi:carbon storage regulator